VVIFLIIEVIMAQAVGFSPIFQAKSHEGVEHFSILDTKIKSIFKKIFDAIVWIPMWIPRKIYSGIHSLIGMIVYPAPLIHKSNKVELDAKLAEFGEKQVTFKAADGAELKGAFFKATEETNVTMICYLGNADNCFSNRTPEFMQGLADKFGVNVLFFNYRNNYPSNGSVSKEGLILDGDAAFQYIRSLGYEENKIILHGSSLGGAIAAQVAAMHPQVNYCNDRSFSKLSSEITQIIGGGILGKIVASLAKFFGWEFDTISSWQNIQGNKWIIYNQKDGIIKKGARLGESFEGKEFVLDTYYNNEEHKRSIASAYNIRNPQQFKQYNQYVGQLEHCFNIFDQEDCIRFYKDQVASIKA
jgi:hypothetical protein